MYGRGLKGFTLLEIMIVLVILSMLLGIGVGVFSKVGSGPEIALSRIREVVRDARFHAKKERAPSTVILDTENNRVRGLGWKNVGCWHFEEADTEGFSTGFPEELRIGSGVIRPNGVIGSCIEFSSDLLSGLGGSRSDAYIPAAPSLDSIDGVSIECHVFPLVGGACRFFSKGDVFTLGVNDEGYLEASLKLGKSDNSKATTVTLDSAPYRLPVGRWTKVGLQFSGYAFYVLAGGVVRNVEAFSQRVTMDRHIGLPLQLGPPGPSGERLNARLDELHLSAVVIGEEVPFHESIGLLGKSRSLHFDARGFLDENFHTRPEEIEITYRNACQMKLTLGMMGELR